MDALASLLPRLILPVAFKVSWPEGSAIAVARLMLAPLNESVPPILLTAAESAGAPAAAMVMAPPAVKLKVAPFWIVSIGAIRFSAPPVGMPESSTDRPTVRVPSLLAVILSLALNVTDEKPTVARFSVAPPVGRLLAS